ncbi:hypothetical protein ACIQVE_27405 [Pseudomonas sp. NPDC098747]|uniref:hypothetical protein n=1 Tax=Pseudomonas sp. NPDC098747 TaxID=3364487 RepID=UPI00383BCD20
MTTYLIEPCEGGPAQKAEVPGAINDRDPANTLKRTTWDEWFDEEKCGADFILLREQS